MFLKWFGSGFGCAVAKKTTIKCFGVVLERFWEGFERKFELVLKWFQSGFGGGLPTKQQLRVLESFWKGSGEVMKGKLKCF